MALDKSIEVLTICCDDILYIRCILQTTFYLERGGTCLDELVQMLALIQILQGEQMALLLKHLTIGIQQVELHAAELSTGSSVGRTTKAMLGCITKTTIADT